MAIELEEPIVLEPRDLKVFPHLWLWKIIVDTPNDQVGTVSVYAYPWNANTNEQLTTSPEYIECRDIWKCAEEVPEVAAAIDAIIEAITPMKNWILTQQQNEVT